MLCVASEDMFRWEFIVSGAYLKEKSKGWNLIGNSPPQIASSLCPGSDTFRCSLYFADAFLALLRPTLLSAAVGCLPRLAPSHVCVSVLSHVWLSVTHASLSMEFSRQEYWSGLPFPSPGGLPSPGDAPFVSPALAGRFFTTTPPGKPAPSNGPT